MIDFIRKNESKIIVLADKHTLELCYPKLKLELPHLIVPYGEGYKNLQSCEYIWKKLTELNAHRDSILFCLGGGIICDMGAFAGQCYQRGMKVVLCPTSLLAMVDAAIGGKNGVNFLGFKNYIGSFNTPFETFVCPDFLESLPKNELTNGYVEMLKHGLIANTDHYNHVKEYFLGAEPADLPKLIRESITIKERHVKEDFQDHGIRKRLNFGHTIGHAIESWSLLNSNENNELSHGISVALGMIAESYISTKESTLSESELNEVTTVLHPILKNVKELPSVEDLIPYLKHDKKNINNQINFSLLSAIGQCTENHLVSNEVIEKSIDYLHQSK